MILRDCERVERGVGLDQDCAVGAHRQAGAQLLLPGGLADRDQHDLAGLFLLDAERFFDGDFAKRVDDPFDVVGGDAAAVGEDADGGGGIGNSLDWY